MPLVSVDSASSRPLHRSMTSPCSRIWIVVSLTLIAVVGAMAAHLAGIPTDVILWMGSLMYLYIVSFCLNEAIAPRGVGYLFKLAFVLFASTMIALPLLSWLGAGRWTVHILTLGIFGGGSAYELAMLVRRRRPG